MTGARLEIRLFGSLAVLRDGRELQLPRSKKARALLAYLVTSDRAHAREQLCDLLWDGPADPRAELRWTLAKIRPLLNEPGATRLVADPARVGFEATGVDIDLQAVRTRLPAEPAAAPTEALQQAATRLRGPFLEGLDLPECYRFDAWCVAQREALRRLHDAVLRTLIGRLRDEPEMALEHARDRLLMDPLSEEAHTDLMALLATLGRMNEALERYERCRRMLAQEFGRPPSSALEQVRRGITQTRPGPAAHQRPVPAETEAPPMRGRRRERERIERRVADQCAGKPSPAVLMTGEPGIGKTRLLTDLKARIRAAGGEVLAGRAFEVEQGRPYAAWVEVLRSIGGDRVPAEVRPELAQLLPELGPSGDEVSRRDRLFDAVAHLLEALAEQPGPLALVLDDIQWLDDASVALTHYVGRALTGRGLLLAMAARDGELEENVAATRLVQTLRRERRLDMLSVAPLGAEETAGIVRSIAPGLDAERIFRESDGNPLFVQQIARSLSQGGQVVSDTLTGMVGERLTGLDRAAADIVPWAAALGRCFSLEVLAAVTNLPPRSLLAALEELERRALIRVSPAGGYEFAHDVIRQAAYRRASEPRRRMTHLQIARTLSRTIEQDHARANEVAHHADLGGDHELAARACALAGRHGLRLFAYDEVAGLVERGLANLDPLLPDKRIPLHLDLLGLYTHPGMLPFRPAGLEDALWALLDEARAQGMNAQARTAFNTMSVLYYLRGDLGNALGVLQRAEDMVRPPESEARVDAFAHTARCLGMLGRRMDRAARLADEAAAIAARIGMTERDCSLAVAQALIHHHNGELDRARERFERGLALARQDPNPWWEYYCLSRLPIIELERDQAAEALAQCRELGRVAARLGPGAEAPFAAALEALARLADGEVHAAAAVDRALTRLREADSLGMIAYIQNVAAEVDRRAGREASARERSEEALRDAVAVDQCSEAAIARATLGRLARKANEAARYLDGMSEDLAAHGRLSARAVRAVRGAMESVSG